MSRPMPPGGGTSRRRAMACSWLSSSWPTPYGGPVPPTPLRGGAVTRLDSLGWAGRSRVDSRLRVGLVGW